MKRLFSIFAIVAVALFTSCGESQSVDEPTPTDNATLNIDDNLIQVSSAGGDYTITYTLEGGSVANLEARAAAEWIHSFDLSLEGELSFTVDANTETSSRTANLYLSHGKVEDKIVVSQAGLNAGDIEYSFDISFDIDGPFVDMTVSPQPEGTRYYAWYYSQKGMEEALAQSPGVDIVQYFNRLVEVELSNAIYYGAYAGYSAEESVSQITLVGEDTQTFELNAMTDFYGFVCAVSDGGERLSDVVYAEFTTGPVQPSTNDIEIAVESVYSDRFTYTVNTTNGDQYATIVFPLSEVEALSDEEIIVMFNDIDNYLPYLHRDNYTTTSLVEHSDTDYCILAFGFSYGMATTEIKREIVHTSVYDPSLKPEFSIDITKVTNFRIQATVDTTPDGCLYYADYCYEADTAEELKAMVHEAAQWYVSNGYFSSLAAAMQWVCFKGRQEFDFAGLYPESKYRIFAIGVDELTGEFTTDVFFTEVVTTPAKELSEGYIEIAHDKYFDGFDIMEHFPEDFVEADGWAVLPLEVTTHGDVVDYYYDVYTGDVTDTSYPTDQEIILDLQNYGLYNEPLSMSYCYFYEPLTLIYFSKDSNDNRSAVTRVLFTLTPEGCAPIEEFDYDDYGVDAEPSRTFKRQ